MRGSFRGPSGSYWASACLYDGRVASATRCPPPGGWAPHSASHPQPDVLRDMWRVPSAHRAGLGPLLPPTLPCLASVSMWTPRVRGGRWGPTANVGLGGGPSSGPSAALETGSSPHPPSLEGPCSWRSDPRRAGTPQLHGPCPTPSAGPLDCQPLAPSSALSPGEQPPREDLLLRGRGLGGLGGAGREGVSAPGLGLPGPWRAGLASPQRSRGLPPARQAPSAHGLLTCQQPVPTCSPSFHLSGAHWRPWRPSMRQQ